jgi:hypothetical protein
MAEATHQARRGYDGKPYWCEPDWCEPDWCEPYRCDPGWCDPCADTDAVDIKKLKEALKKASGDLDGDKAEKVIEQVIHAVRLARSFEAMRKKRWSQRGGRYGDCD